MYRMPVSGPLNCIYFGLIPRYSQTCNGHTRNSRRRITSFGGGGDGGCGGGSSNGSVRTMMDVAYRVQSAGNQYTGGLLKQDFVFLCFFKSDCELNDDLLLSNSMNAPQYTNPDT